MKYVILCATWYHLYNFKNVKNTHGGVLLLVKMQGSACKFTKSNTLAWVFCTFLKFVYCANGTKSRKVSHTKYTAWNIHHHIIFLSFSSDCNLLFLFDHFSVLSFKRQKRQQPTNCLSVFYHFVGLAHKGLKYSISISQIELQRIIIVRSNFRH